MIISFLYSLCTDNKSMTLSVRLRYQVLDPRDLETHPWSRNSIHVIQFFSVFNVWMVVIKCPIHFILKNTTWSLCIGNTSFEPMTYNQCSRLTVKRYWNYLRLTIWLFMHYLSQKDFLFKVLHCRDLNYFIILPKSHHLLHRSWLHQSL